MADPVTTLSSGQLLSGASPPDYGVFCNNEEFSDLQITVGNNTYFGHRIVLAMASEVFQTMLSSVWCTTSDLNLEETGNCEGVFPEFLQFLYTWRVRLNEENVIPLALLSDKYLVKDLATLCIDFMVNEVSSENAIPWFKFSLKYNVEKVYNECIKFVSLNFEHFHQSGKLVELDSNEMSLVLDSGSIVCKSEMDIIQAILKWMKAYDRPVQENLRDDIVKLFSSVRAPMLTPADIDKIEKTKELEDFVMLLLPKFYLSYKYHSFGMKKQILPNNNKMFKNYVPRIYTERCGTEFSTTTFWEQSFQTPSHMCSLHTKTLKWKYQNQKPNELELLIPPLNGKNMTPCNLRVVRLTKRVRKGFAEVKIITDTVHEIAHFGPCIDMGEAYGFEKDVRTHGLMIAILPVGLPA